jgi:hypothetical protein
MEGGAVGHNFERDPPGTITARFGLIWFNGFRGKHLNVIFYQNMANLHNRHKSAERKYSQKIPEYMLNYSCPCSCSKTLSSFRLTIKQQWTIEDISIFSNISHLEWRADLSDTILKRTHLRTFPARFGLIWFRGFRGEDLNVKVYDVQRVDGRTPTDDGHQVMTKAKNNILK